jgi:hypothetical protein
MLISGYLPDIKDSKEKNHDDHTVSFVGDRLSRFLMEMPKYVFNKDVEFFDIKNKEDSANEKAHEGNQNRNKVPQDVVVCT